MKPNLVHLHTCGHTDMHDELLCDTRVLPMALLGRGKPTLAKSSICATKRSAFRNECQLCGKFVNGMFCTILRMKQIRNAINAPTYFHMINKACVHQTSDSKVSTYKKKDCLNRKTLF